jgi:hypothetical protein
VKAAIRAGQEKMEVAANAMWCKEIAISDLVEGVLVSVDKRTQNICEEPHMEIQGTQPST